MALELWTAFEDGVVKVADGVDVGVDIGVDVGVDVVQTEVVCPN